MPLTMRVVLSGANLVSHLLRQTGPHPNRQADDRRAHRQENKVANAFSWQAASYCCDVQYG